MAHSTDTLNVNGLPVMVLPRDTDGLGFFATVIAQHDTAHGSQVVTLIDDKGKIQKLDTLNYLIMSGAGEI